jgi:hypothetical protein
MTSGPRAWITYIALVGACWAYPSISEAADPPVSTDELAGKYVGTAGDSPSKITVLVATDGSVSIGGTFQDWDTKYDSAQSEITAARKARIDDFPASPDWAKAMAVDEKKVEWTLSLRATINNNIVTLSGQWDNKKISYSVGTKRAISVTPNLLALKYEKACNKRRGSAKWRDASKAEQQALDAAREEAKWKKELDSAEEKIKKWNTDHENDRPPPAVPDDLLRPATEANTRLQAAQRTAKDTADRAKTLWRQVAPPLSQRMAKDCEICTTSAVISALSGQAVDEKQVLTDAQGVDPPYDPKKGSVPATIVAVLKKHGLTDAKDVANITPSAIRRNLLCGPILLNNKSGRIGHSLFVYAFTYDDKNTMVLKGWNPGDGTPFERTVNELTSEGWNGSAIVANPYD